MRALYFIALFYLYIPFICGAVRWIANKSGFSEKTFGSYLANRFHYSNSDIRFFMAISFIMSLLFPCVIYGKLIDPQNEFIKIVTIFAVVAIAATSSVYALTSELVKAGFKKYQTYWTLFLTASGAVNASRATSYAEGLISNITPVRGSDLPTALARLSIVMTPVAWIISLSFFFVFIYAAVLFKAVVFDSKSNTKNAYIITETTDKKLINKFISGLAIAFSFAMLAVSYLNILDIVLKSKRMEQFVREQIADASFHTQPSKCGIHSSKSGLIAYLEDGKAILAQPDESLSYTFKGIECPREWLKPEQIEKTTDEKSKLINI